MGPSRKDEGALASRSDVSPRANALVSKSHWAATIQRQSADAEISQGRQSVNVLLVYHGGLTASTTRLYRAIAQHTDVERLAVVVPERIESDRIYAPSGWLTAEASDSGDGYDVHPIALNDPTDYSRGFDRKALGSVLSEARPDVIHVLDEPFSGYLLQVIQLAVAHARRARVVFYGFENRPLRFGRTSRLIWKAAWPRTAGGAAANSEALENLRRAGYPSGRPLERIFWGIPTDLFADGDGENPLELGVDADKLIGYVGRLVIDKGLLVLAAAMLRLPPEVHCVFIGSGPLRAELELFGSLPALAGRLHFASALEPEELARALARFDVLALPSLTMPRWKEQYGRVLAEGMAAGVPVVASDSGAIPEVVGNAGSIVPEGDSVALADALHSAMFDTALRDRLIQEGRRRASEELSIPVMAGRLVSFYGQILRS